MKKYNTKFLLGDYDPYIYDGILAIIDIMIKQDIEHYIELGYGQDEAKLIAMINSTAATNVQPFSLN